MRFHDPLITLRLQGPSLPPNPLGGPNTKLHSYCFKRCLVCSQWGYCNRWATCTICWYMQWRGNTHSLIHTANLKVVINPNPDIYLTFGLFIMSALLVSAYDFPPATTMSNVKFIIGQHCSYIPERVTVAHLFDQFSQLSIKLDDYLPTYRWGVVSRFL